MENKGLRRLEESVRKLLDQHGHAATRTAQLAAALAKSREEIEKLKAQNHRLKTERAEARKRVDAIIKRLDAMGPELEVDGR